MKLNCVMAALAAAVSLPPTLVAATSVQQTYIKASNTGVNDTFGYAVAISGDTMVVGAPSESSGATGVNGDEDDNSAANSGAAYIFVRSGTNWIQQAYLKASNTGVDDRFGYRVAIDGNTVVIGAHQEDSRANGVSGDGSDNGAADSGAAYVFVRDGTNWSQQAYLKASNTGANDLFGRAVAVSGDTIVVGANQESSNAIGVNGNQNDNSAAMSGAAYIFVRNGTNWTQQAYLKASNTDVNDQFGMRVAVSGDTVVVGAWREDSSAVGVNGNQADNSAHNSGAAYVFVRHETNWSQQAYLKASNAGADDYFGISLAISGDTIVVGAYMEDSGVTGVNGNGDDNSAPDSGAAYIFVRNGADWTQQAYLKASNTGGNDWFGFSVAVSGNTVMIGAPQESSNAIGIDGEQSDNNALNSGAAYIFVRNGTSWIQQAYYKASNTGVSDTFGWVVGISDDTAVVGAPLEDSNAIGVGGEQSDNGALDSGATYVFAGLGLTPPVAPVASVPYFKASNTSASDNFGYTVAVAGDTVVVGAPFEDGNGTGVNADPASTSLANSGAAYIFVRRGTNWFQQAYLKASNPGTNDQFGYSVAISGDTVVVGAPFEASNVTGVNGYEEDNSMAGSGAAYVFVRSGTNWSQQAYLKASNTGTNDRFGSCVAIHGNTTIVGAPRESSSSTGVNGSGDDDNVLASGAAYVFVRTGANWSQQAFVKASNNGAGNQFGISAAIAGDTMLIGANGEDRIAQDSGSAYVFVRNGTNWMQQAYLKAPNPTGGARFGDSVAISGETLVVGSRGERSGATGVNGNYNDTSANLSGAAYVFVRSGTNWSQQAYLKASNTRAVDLFGLSVGISMDTIVVGAYGEDSNAVGVNGNQSDDSVPTSGAAYIFVRTGTNWSQQAYLKAFNTGASDAFGFAAAVSGDVVVVGAPYEDSNATGVNGNQSDNSAADSGAAYVFDGLGLVPQLAIAPDGQGGYFMRSYGIIGATYEWLRATNVSGPWTTNAMTTTLSPGTIEFHDTNAPSGQAFYRVVRQ